MDFFTISTKIPEEKKGKESVPEIYADFKVGRSKDLMVRARSFYAIWDEKAGLWSTDEYDVQRLVDEALDEYAAQIKQKTGVTVNVKHLRSFSSNSWAQFRRFLQNISDNSHQLDESLTFANTDVKKSDYVSRRLPYALEEGDYSAWDELVGTLYNVEERAKIEWFIGSVVSGDSKKIQKFGVFYGPPASGKGTILDIVERLFPGYTTTFDGKALGSSNGTFATEVFKDNPLVAIQQDGDLSRIEDNARLNSIISHENMSMNEKYKPGYTAKVNAILLLGTNKPVKITDAKSGIIRRLIDIHPTGVTIPNQHYHVLMQQVDFELGAIASHCLRVYRAMGKQYYSNYRPTEMMLQTDVFFNFIEAYFDVFKSQDLTTLRQAYALYKEYCEETGVPHILPQYRVREELRNYFDEFHERGQVDGVNMRSVYRGFNANKFKVQVKGDAPYALIIEQKESIFDELAADWPAQGWRVEEDTGRKVPKRKWVNVTTTLSDLVTSDLHFVRVPENLVVIDFDLLDESGNKSLERNLAAASAWPATYAELSQSESGVHLCYWYDGDVTELSAAYSDGIEVKTLLGDASLRRKMTRCNNVPIATLKTGMLPIKEKKVLSEQQIKSEKGLRDMIARNLQKEFHPSTVSSIDFIKKILDDAYESGMQYDVTDMRNKIMAFANNASNQSMRALNTVMEMKFEGQVQEQNEETGFALMKPKDERIAFFDLEVYPNLFVICWKFAGEASMVRMINPSPAEVEDFLKLKLVGFNNRRYDNHILWAAFMGYNNAALYKLSQKIINNERSGMFGEAYNLSYADIYDFCSEKHTLKWWEIELGIPHVEMDLSWDEPVPPELWDKVVDYCCNDVMGAEAVFEARRQDFVARQILADLSGLSVNDTTAKHTARIIFGQDYREPQGAFVYTDLSELFPGYTYDPMRKPNRSEYRGEDPSEGGYVYSEPGMYENVAVLDISSMHPTSIEQLNLFGKYTPMFAALKEARVAIKHKDYDSAKNMLNGKLAPFLENPADAKALSDALKIVINSVYGLTSASFTNPFRDNRNVDNIVAKRGALFMIDLKHYVQEEGFQVVHIKTDSIKIPNATPEIIEKVTNFGSKYGYDFEHEKTYDKFCLVNDAVYIARTNDADWDHDGESPWDAVGAQFQHPYVYKTLFSGEEIEFKDLCEAKHVQKGAMYLDFEHDKPEPVVDRMQFIGRSGLFVPVVEGSGGGVLYRVNDVENKESGEMETKLYAVAGTKGYLWMEASMAATLNQKEDVAMSYFEKLADEAIAQINKFGSFEEFVE